MTAFLLICFLISMFCTTTNAVRRRHRFAYCHRSISGCPSISIVPRGGGVEEENVSLQEQTFEILEEKLLFSHWRTVSSRLVRFPDGRTANFDIVGNKNSDHAVLVFAWNSQSKTATLIREYMPGSNSMKYGIAAGLVEDKHIHINGEDDDDDDDQDGTGDIQKLIAAQHELEEECHLIGGEWIKLTDDTLLDKYASTQATVYLNLNAKIAPNPKPLDAEEEIVIVPNVTIPEILEMIAKGEMNCVGAWACLVAIQRLRELGEIE